MDRWDKLLAKEHLVTTVFFLNAPQGTGYVCYGGGETATAS